MKTKLDAPGTPTEAPSSTTRISGEAAFVTRVAEICGREHGVPDPDRYVAQRRSLVTRLMLRDLSAETTARFVADEYRDDLELAHDPRGRELRAASRRIQQYWAIFRVPRPDPTLDELTEAEYSATIAGLLERFELGHGELVVARQRMLMADALRDPARTDAEVVRAVIERTGVH